MVSDLLRITPTPDSYALAAKLWTSLGDRKQAAQVRAEARRRLGHQVEELASAKAAVHQAELADQRGAVIAFRLLNGCIDSVRPEHDRQDKEERLWGTR